ncbi:hypothetical protein MBLNU457_4019t1 [Dothideomycetes sp. NU457]
MPYDTRRKSVSLSLLGVHIPKRARQSSTATSPRDVEGPPTKKSRAGSSSPPPGAMSPPSSTNIRVKTELPSHPRGAEHTPPPSPGAEGVQKVDTTGIKDEIVVGVIRQLEKTGNRPHTSKELAAVLANSVPTIDASTNPNALIQARLASYLKGPWPIVSPCPLGKQQENIHPRRVFYYLTTQPHQPIPEVSAMVPISRRVISPALSSHADDEAESKYMRDRSRLSPSPEVVLSSPELEDESDMDVASTFSGRSSLSLSRDMSSSNLSHNRRAQSPPLEREERDFKQTANELQEQRRNSRQRAGSAPTDNAIKTEDNTSSDVRNTIEMSDDNDSSLKAHKEPLPSLFPNSDSLAFEFSSPVLRPQHAPMHLDGKVLQPLTTETRQALKAVDTISLDMVNNDPMDISSAWDENGQLRSPEDIELDELQGVFDGYY